MLRFDWRSFFFNIPRLATRCVMYPKKRTIAERSTLSQRKRQRLSKASRHETNLTHWALD